MTLVDSSFKAYMTKPGLKHKAKLITAHACNTGYTYNIILGHYLLESCFSSEISKNGMRAGGSLPLSIICIKGFLNQNLSNND